MTLALLDLPPALPLEDEDAEPSEYLPLRDERAAARDRLRFAARGHGPASMRLAGRLLVEHGTGALAELRRLHEGDGRLYREACRWLGLAGVTGQEAMPW